MDATDFAQSHLDAIAWVARDAAGEEARCTCSDAPQHRHDDPDDTTRLDAGVSTCGADRPRPALTGDRTIPSHVRRPNGVYRGALVAPRVDRLRLFGTSDRAGHTSLVLNADIGGFRYHATFGF